jgi:5-methylcytosine-specific restriction endonuclease McrA
MPTSRVCGGCLRPTRNGAYCRKCAPLVEKRRHNPARDRGDYRRARAQAIAAYVRRHGWICRGFRRPAHASRDLTINHRVPLVAGGPLLYAFSDDDVWCRACNSRIGPAIMPR